MQKIPQFMYCGIFHVYIVEYQLFITSKHHQNHAEKSWILNTIPNGVTHYSDT